MKTILSLLVAAVFLSGCPGGPLARAPSIDNPTIAITGPTAFTQYCDGSFDARYRVAASYAAPAGSRPGRTRFDGVHAATAMNMDSPTITGAPMTFTADEVKFLEVRGKLTSPCDPGKLKLEGTATHETGRTDTVSSADLDKGPLAVTGKGPNPDPRARLPDGTYSFRDTLHCCPTAGTSRLAAVIIRNADSVTASRNSIACAGGPAGDVPVTMSGKLTSVEIPGVVELRITPPAGAQACVVRTEIQTPQ